MARREVSGLARLVLVALLLASTAAARRKNRPNRQGQLERGGSSVVEPVQRGRDRARRAPDPQIEDDYLEEDYNYVDGYDDYYTDDYESYDENGGGPNRGDQSLVSPETTPPPPPSPVPSYTPSAEVTYPCADYKPGDDDLQSFDFIRKFELDVNLDGYPGVARVREIGRAHV